MGVSGFRVDAAMWMPPDDLKIIFSSLTEAPYVVQEVSYREGNPVTPQLYTEVSRPSLLREWRICADAELKPRKVGYVHEFRAMFYMTEALINGGGISSLLQWPSSSWVASASANVFAA